MVYSRFRAEILPQLALPPLSRAILLAFRNADVTAERIGQLIAANPCYLELLGRRWAGQLRMAKDELRSEPRADHILVQLGMESSRNLLIAAQAVRSVSGRHPAWSEDGAPGFDPSAVVRFALRAETEASRIPGEIAAIAYAAGLLFDLLALREAPPEARSYLDSVFERGLRAAQIASALGRRLPQLRLRRYLFGAALLQAAGRALLAATEPGFVRFDHRCEERGLPRPVSEFAIRSRYGISPAQLSAQAGMAMGIFRKAERALLFSEEPYLLRSDPKPVYQLAAVLRLASNIAARPSKIDVETDPRLALWKGLELRELPIEAAELVSISKMMT